MKPVIQLVKDSRMTSLTADLSSPLLPRAVILSRKIYYSVVATGAALFLVHTALADPGEWDFTNKLTSPRESHTTTLLPSGKVLVAAGGSDEDSSSATTELYDPATKVWSATGSLTGRRNNQSATLLPNGMVLVAGGYDTSFGGGTLATCELYDPATGTWSTTGSMHDPRLGHSAILLNTGKVLVVAG